MYPVDTSPEYKGVCIYGIGSVWIAEVDMICAFYGDFTF